MLTRALQKKIMMNRQSITVAHICCGRECCGPVDTGVVGPESAKFPGTAPPFLRGGMKKLEMLEIDAICDCIIINNRQ